MVDRFDTTRVWSRVCVDAWRIRKQGDKKGGESAASASTWRATELQLDVEEKPRSALLFNSPDSTPEIDTSGLPVSLLRNHSCSGHLYSRPPVTSRCHSRLCISCDILKHVTWNYTFLPDTAKDCLFYLSLNIFCHQHSGRVFDLKVKHMKGIFLLPLLVFFFFSKCHNTGWHKSLEPTLISNSKKKTHQILQIVFGDIVSYTFLWSQRLDIVGWVRRQGSKTHLLGKAILYHVAYSVKVLFYHKRCRKSHFKRFTYKRKAAVWSANEALSFPLETTFWDRGCLIWLYWMSSLIWLYNRHSKLQRKFWKKHKFPNI